MIEQRRSIMKKKLYSISRNNSYEEVECPNCKEISTISIQKVWRYWLADACWKCPNCNQYTTTEEMQDHANAKRDCSL